MLFSMTEQEWDAVIRVHLKGTFATSHHASIYWRNRSKASQPNDARIINTASVAGLYAKPGQTNSGSAKAAVATFTQIAAMELDRYGETVNAIAPRGADPPDRGPFSAGGRCRPGSNPGGSHPSWHGSLRPSRPASSVR